MKNILEWFTKSRILVISLVSSVLIFLFLDLANKARSFEQEHLYEGTALIFGIFIPIFLITLISYFLKEKVFTAWRKFTFIYLSIYLLVILVTPSYCDAYLPICKQMSFMFLVPIYFVISLILIIYKSIRNY